MATTRILNMTLNQLFSASCNKIVDGVPVLGGPNVNVKAVRKIYSEDPNVRLYGATFDLVAAGGNTDLILTDASLKDVNGDTITLARVYAVEARVVSGGPVGFIFPGDVANPIGNTETVLACKSVDYGDVGDTLAVSPILQIQPNGDLNSTIQIAFAGSQV